MKYIKISGLVIFFAALVIFTGTLGMGKYKLTNEVLQSTKVFPESTEKLKTGEEVTVVNKRYQRDMIQQCATELGMINKEYSSQISFVSDLKIVLQNAKDSLETRAVIKDWKATNIPPDVREWDYRMGSTKDYRFSITKYSTIGILVDQSQLWFLLSFIMGIAGALMYILPKIAPPAGIKNNGIFQSSMHNRGGLGIAAGIYLIGFYILLYFSPEWITSWTILLDPISRGLSGNDASQWFLYGFLYTIAVSVMGIRMMLKYRHNMYQIVRTMSVIFFQTAFAFLIPEILVRLNQPYFDFKNMWPLDYDFFFEWNLNTLIGNGGLGIFMLVWGIALFLIGVPVITYFYGKRWYCSWVCGCGGLAETLGDPYRQLSDKSVKAWKIERYMIHGVLVFAVIMTSMVLYTYFSGNNNVLFLSSFQVREVYGFAIGSVFSGVIGTGFYPLMGNRAWCRFGCPLAAYLGLVQKFKSRFRITTNGAQCISCGNCSTYCEMGIDVRAYAQKGQDIVRSSCVGCGVCAAVCPRGVLRLENGSVDIDTRTIETRAIHISADEVRLLM